MFDHRNAFPTSLNALKNLVRKNESSAKQVWSGLMRFFTLSWHFVFEDIQANIVDAPTTKIRLTSPENISSFYDFLEIAFNIIPANFKIRYESEYTNPTQSQEVAKWIVALDNQENRNRPADLFEWISGMTFGCDVDFTRNSPSKNVTPLEFARVATKNHIFIETVKIEIR